MKPEFKHHQPAPTPAPRPLAAPQAPRGLLARGPLALMLAGGVLLAASAVAGRVFWAEDRAALAEPPVPEVWIAAFEPERPARFTDGPDEAPLPVFPLVRILPGPQVMVRDVPAPAEPAMIEAGLPLLPAPRLASRANDPAADPGRDPVDAGDSAAMVPRVAFTLPPMLPPRRPAVPQLYQAPEPTLLALEADAPGMIRSPLPRARPQHLAVSLPAAPVAAPGTARSTAPAALAVAAPLTAPLTGAEGRCEPALTRAIPARPGAAPGGSVVLAGLTNSAGSARDDVIARAITAGNLPEFQRRLVPVTLAGRDERGQDLRITLCVMPDYLAIGSNADFVRVPLGLPAANRIAEQFDMVLPTTRMVDAIHVQAGLRLAPEPMTPGPQMASTEYFVRHNATLERQRRAAGAALGVLVSGHKKDLVLSNRLARNPGRVAIYGWHRASGQPIQPLSTVHGAAYADYSHGIRLISRRAYVNGRAVDLRDLLADGRYAGLLSDEGPIAPRLMLAALD